MDIPDESPWGPAPDVVRVEFVDSGEITPELTVGLLADIKQVQRERDAAIARTAQMAVLTDILERIEGQDIESVRDMSIYAKRRLHALERTQGRRTDLKKD